MRARQTAQRGAALLVMAVVLILGSAWWLASALSEALNRTAEDRAHNAKMLSQAKAALIGYVAHKAAKPGEDDPGALPCPESDGDVGNATNEGRAGPNCALPAVGRLPWKTLGLDQLRDAANEPLWYVVSPGWAKPNSTTNTVINSNSVGQLNVDGSAAVALIIAPGRAVTTNCSPPRNQVRTVPAPGINALDYIECLSGSSYSANSSDQSVVVTAADVLPAIEAAIAWRFEQELAPQIRSAYSGGLWPAGQVLPFAVPFGHPASSPANRFQGAPVISAGSASVVNNSATVTLSVPMTPSMTGRYFRPQGSSGAYRIGDHVSGSNSLTLSSIYTGATNGAAPYQIFAAEGLLPVNYSTCVGGDPRCDPAFVAWRTPATITRSAGGNLHSYSCSVAGVPSTLTCTLRYSTDLNPYRPWIEFTLEATASNTGMALRQLDDTVPVAGAVSHGISGATMNSDGSATLSMDSRVEAASGGSPLAALGSLVCNMPGPPGSPGPPLCFENTISVPIAMFSDHPVVDPGNATYNWFYRNNWHQVAYYAAAPNVTPSGPRSCVTSATCLAVNYHPDDGKHRGLVVLSGRSLAGAARPNGTLSDWLEGGNEAGASPFTVRSPALMINRSFNDRIAVIDKNP